MEPGEESLPMQVSDGFHLQESAPAALDQTLDKRYVLLRRCMEWFTGQISRKAHLSTRRVYDFSVELVFDQSTHSMALPLDKYIEDENANEGSWVLLEPDKESQSEPHREGGRAQERRLRTPNVRNVAQPG